MSGIFLSIARKIHCASILKPHFTLTFLYPSHPFLFRLFQSIAPNGSTSLSDTQSQASQQIPSIDESFSSAYTSVSLCLIDTRSLLDTATSHSVLIPRIAELNVSC